MFVRVAENVVCVYLVLVFEILMLAHNCCLIKINGSSDILQPALNKHDVCPLNGKYSS
jgi:hypothetical protein